MNVTYETCFNMKLLFVDYRSHKCTIFDSIILILKTQYRLFLLFLLTRSKKTLNGSRRGLCSLPIGTRWHHQVRRESAERIRISKCDPVSEFLSRVFAARTVFYALFTSGKAYTRKSKFAQDLVTHPWAKPGILRVRKKPFVGHDGFFPDGDVACVRG